MDARDEPVGAGAFTPSSGHHQDMDDPFKVMGSRSRRHDSEPPISLTHRDIDRSRPEPANRNPDAKETPL